jgi:hypothetical protein
MPYPEHHDLGDLVEVTGTFTDPADDTALDPDVVNLSFIDPSGSVTTWVYGTDEEVEKSATGVYVAYIDADEAGTWYYRWWSTGDGQAAAEKSFVICTALAVEE